MTQYSKKGAYEKLDNIASNVLYDKWIENDEQMEKFYETRLFFYH